MANHFRTEPKSTTDRRQSLPSIEDGGIDDHTVASPALGFGMDRADLLDEQLGNPSAGANEATPFNTHNVPTEEPVPETLRKNEVAAVSTDRSFYVSDMPSPYLSPKQASEDVRVTRRRHSIILVTIVTIVLVGAMGAAGWYLWNVMQPRQTLQVKQYETTPIEYGEYLETVDTTSLVQPVNEVTVTAGSSGRIAEVYVENGAIVQEGDWILYIDNPTVSDAANKAQESLDSFYTEVEKRQQELDKANEAVTKAQEAVDKDDKNESARLELEAAKQGAERAQSALDTANNNLWNMQQTYNQAQEQQAKLTVIAPITGTVSNLAELSNSVSSSTSVCRIEDTSCFSIVMEIPNEVRDRVEVGQEVRLAFPTIEDLNITTSVSSLDENGDMLLAKVLIENPDERIETGIAAEASLILVSVPDAHIIPSRAIHTSNDGSTFIKVLLDPSRGIVVDVPVEVLASDGTYTAIAADNIQEGNAVVMPEEE